MLVIIAALGLYGLLGTMTATPAFAHAELVTSTPTAGQTLATAPAVLSLRFTETIDVDAVQARLVDPTGAVLDTHVMVAEDTVQLHPMGKLGLGDHVISWKLVSADGHLVSGLVPFRIGTGPLPADTPTVVGGTHSGVSGPLDRGAEAISWILVALALAGGATGRRRVAVSAAAAGAFTAGLRVWEYGVAYGSNPLVIGEARAAGLVAAAALLVALVVFHPLRAVVLCTSVLVFAGQSLVSGHHLDLEGPALQLATIAHAVHLAAVLTWTAAVAALLLRRDGVQARRTRTVSTVAVAALAVAAPVLTFSLVRPIGFADRWTQLLLVKVLLLGFVAVLAWRNHRRAGSSQPEPRLWRRSVQLEVALFVAVAGLSAALTTATPPSVTVSRQVPASTDTPRPGSAQDGSGAVQLTKIGFNGGATASLSYDNSSGRWTVEFPTPVGTDRIEVTGTNPEAGVDGFSVTLSGDGRTYSAVRTLPLDGRWQLELTFLADRFDLQTTTTTLEIGERP
jgi:copper transport protein